MEDTNAPLTLVTLDHFLRIVERRGQPSSSRAGPKESTKTKNSLSILSAYEMTETSAQARGTGV
jgi:hypothetical protein